MDLSAAMQHNSEYSDAQSKVFPFQFGDINRIKRPNYRFYYCYAPRGGFMYLRHVGSAGYEDIKNNVVQIINDDAWSSGTKLFSDLRWANYNDVSFDEHYKLSRETASLHEKDGRYLNEMAAVCSEDLEFGMQRMLQAFLDEHGQALSVFRDIESAVKLLQIDRELLDRIIAEVDKIEASYIR